MTTTGQVRNGATRIAPGATQDAAERMWAQGGHWRKKSKTTRM
ncbi:MAG: hypothetical protein AAGB18_04045 [Pseudomonadota bacterium]